MEFSPHRQWAHHPDKKGRTLYRAVEPKDTFPVYVIFEEVQHCCPNPQVRQGNPALPLRENPCIGTRENPITSLVMVFGAQLPKHS